MIRPVIFIVISALVLFGIVYFLATLPKPSFSQNQTAETPSENSEINFDLPGNLINCSKDFFALNDKGGPKYDCDRLDRNLVCAYYKQKYNGQETIVRSEFTNDCYLCKFFGLTGVKQAQNTSYELLGYVGGRCLK